MSDSGHKIKEADVVEVLQDLQSLTYQENLEVMGETFNRKACRKREPGVLRYVDCIAANFNRVGQIGASELLAKMAWYLESQHPDAMTKYFLQEPEE